MSVEPTGTAITVLPVTPKKGEGNEHQSIKEPTDAELSVETRLIGVKGSEDTQHVNQLSKKEVQEEKGEMTVPQLEEVAKKLQEFMGEMNRGLAFSVDEDSGRDVIKVIDKKSGDIIKQYPSEEVLSLVSKLSEATGTFVDAKI